ncbi:MAG: hypothetical protein K8T89_07245 [Planctomycetes bacterium]|nr:hypothetical protein [Planctomycetota bacterium]
MNAALLMLTSAWMAGADHHAPTAAPAVVSTGSSCATGGCATATCDDPCAKKHGLFDRLKGRFAKGCGCEAAPACAPAPVCKVEAPKCNTCNAAPACDSCGSPGLWSKFKARFSKHGASSCNTCDSCASGAPVTTGTSNPEVIPPPKDKKEMPKDLPKGGVTNLRVEPIVTPVVAPRPTIDVSGPTNPF